jgi:hypothetical protein
MVCTPIYCFKLSRGTIWNQLLNHIPSKLRGVRFARISYPWSGSWILLEVLTKIRTSICKTSKKNCATLMISGMNHETLKWKTFPFSLTGWAKQWYKLHVSGCHDSWVVLKDQFYFAFFPLSKIIDLRNEVLKFAQKKESVWEQPGLDIISMPCWV